MRLPRLETIQLIGVPLAVAGIFFGLLMIIQMQPKAYAARSVCHAAMVLDRSGSVGPTNLTTMRNQILRLFQPGGLYNDNIKLAFWSFSWTNPTSNYDAPYNDFVSSKGVSSSFQTNLNKIVSSGATDYEQGFGFDNGDINTYDGMDKIIKKADIIVFMTDGLPNVPGTGNNNATARNAARDAVSKLKQLYAASHPDDPNLYILGGIVGNASHGSLNYVINGSDSNATNTFTISSNYDDLATILRGIIKDSCDKKFPPSTNKFSLTPTVTSNDHIVAGTDGATLSYNVNNSIANGSSDLINWTVKQLIVARGQSVDRLSFDGKAYRDGYSCEQLVALVNDRAQCSQIAAGQRVFASGSTSLDMDAAGATSVVLNDEWGVGTKLCYVLTLDRPTQDQDIYDRYSRPLCIIVGKHPLVQVHGGDIRVGRHFVTDPITVPTDEDGDDSPPAPTSIQTSTTLKTDGRTYGSWAEYGVISPGLVVGFASLSGLEGGYQSTLTNSQQYWSKLTFANTDDEYGLFTSNDIGQGTIPDAASAILAGRAVTDNLTGTNGSLTFNGATAQRRLYQKTSGNLDIEAGTVGGDSTIIVNVPNGTVTIKGDITYYDGPYTDISQIPQLVIIAKAINIDPDVTRVDAWLIANSTSGGTISTCDDPNTLTSQICYKPLTINGAIMARQLNLRRTGGAGAGGAAGDPAEIINLPGGTYLWSQSEGRNGVRAQTTFTTELPPYF